jgi:hypothetical protein
MSEQTRQGAQEAEAIATILEANGLGDRATLLNANVKQCTADAAGNRLMTAEIGNRRYFVTLSPALKGRLVGEDRIEDEEVRLHFGVNIIGEPPASK